MTQTCVIRNVAGLDQYIPIADAFILNPGERSFTGTFANEQQKDGPSGSHLRTICLPRGELKTETLTTDAIKAMGR